MVSICYGDMSIKLAFINIMARHVYGIDMLWRYVDKMRFYKHNSEACLWYRHVMVISQHKTAIRIESIINYFHLE